MFKFFKSFIRVTAGCGHKTRLYDKITVIDKNGEKEEVPLEIIKTLKPSHCHQCIEKMTIKCAWCGDCIIPGDPITLRKPLENFEIPEYAVSYKENPTILVGCLGWDCAEHVSGMDGFWEILGKVELVSSPVE